MFSCNGFLALKSVEALENALLLPWIQTTVDRDDGALPRRKQQLDPPMSVSGIPLPSFVSPEEYIETQNAKSLQVTCLLISDYYFTALEGLQASPKGDYGSWKSHSIFSKS